MAPLRYERACWAAGYLLIGIDEVGRGPLAGPVVAAAVCFPSGHRGIRGVRDSKEVATHGERMKLVLRIRREAISCGVGAASVREIDRNNIRRATGLAMRRALLRCQQGTGTATRVVIDGLAMPELGHEHEALVKGDALCHAIAAASLLAKVVRDRLMHALAGRRPGYGWQTNVGYATREHIAGLHAIGRTPHHRSLFCDTAMGQPSLFESGAVPPIVPR